MPPSKPKRSTSLPTPLARSLSASLSQAGDLAGKALIGATAQVQLADLAGLADPSRSAFVGGAVFSEQAEALRGQSVLLRTADQLAAAIALVALDGVASRIVLCPPDLPAEHLPHVLRTAEVNALVTDGMEGEEERDSLPVRTVLTCRPTGTIASHVRADFACAPGHAGAKDRATEWVLLTSGTTGAPKLVAHTLASLAGALRRPGSRSGAGPEPDPVVWGTFYDIRRYGGLQILLRAITAGASMVLPGPEESLPAFLARSGSSGLTHISGTPSHWRKALMSPAAGRIAPRYVRLSGEIADQAILDHLRAVYPAARISHAFASTEAGLVFEVEDGLAGIPAQVIEPAAAAGSHERTDTPPAVELKVEEGSLRVRSARTASRYLGENSPAIKDAEGFVDTRDLLELRNGRYVFVGRRDGVINVGGQKVYPEEVEAAIHRHPAVQMALVRARKSPITGALVMADIVLRQDGAVPREKTARELEQEILRVCREVLPAYKVPAAINLVASLEVSASGKLKRHA